jgi:hypothetical protein
MHPLFLAALLFIPTGHYVLDKEVGYALNCDKNPEVVCEYKLNER